MGFMHTFGHNLATIIVGGLLTLTLFVLEILNVTHLVNFSAVVEFVVAIIFGALVCLFLSIYNFYCWYTARRVIDRALWSWWRATIETASFKWSIFMFVIGITTCIFAIVVCADTGLSGDAPDSAHLIMFVLAEVALAAMVVAGFPSRVALASLATAIAEIPADAMVASRLPRRA